jgi:glucose/sorbosone dehydrogenase
MPLLAAIVLAAALALGAIGTAGADPPSKPRAHASRIGGGRGGVELRRIGSFRQPVHVTHAGGLLFVVERAGRIRVVAGGRVRRRPFLSMRSLVGSSGSEQGLLSVAFPPDYERSRRFYVNYTDGAGTIRIEEFKRRRRSPLLADPSTRRPLLAVPHPGFSNHNGGLLLFGPDGHLYASLGDGGGVGDPGDNARDLGSLLGKLLRIDPRPGSGGAYRVPSDNPFVGVPGARPEIFSYGLRNPWRFSFQRLSRGRTRIAIGDVGQNLFEEVDYINVRRARGGNFGWPAFEGDASFDPARPGAAEPVPPVLTYGHSGGRCSVTGGLVVRDRRLRSLFGRYMYADFCLGQLRSFEPALSGARADRALGRRVRLVSSFGEDARHRVYVASLRGPVFRLAPR